MILLQPSSNAFSRVSETVIVTAPVYKPRQDIGFGKIGFGETGFSKTGFGEIEFGEMRGHRCLNMLTTRHYYLNFLRNLL
jgi:hypothetical protein